MESTENKNSERILIADGDPLSRRVLANYLGRFYHVDVAENASQALDLVERSFEDYSVVLVTNELPPSGLQCIARVRKDNPHLKIAFLTGSDYDSEFPLLRRYDIFTVLVRSVPFDYDELLITIENMISPHKAMGLRRYLKLQNQCHERVIRSLADKQAMMEEALSFFRRYRPHDTDVSQIRLAFEELINNAFYHAFKRTTGEEKYEMGAFTELERGEQVVVEFGWDKNFLGCSVTDNQGTLDVDTVMRKLERQITREGLLDERGRGLYLTRTLSDKMVINIHQRVATQVILLFAHKGHAKVKPLFINALG